MKKKTVVFIFVLVAGIFMGAVQPALLYSAETGGGAPWDFLVDSSSFAGTKYFGPLTAYFEFLTGDNSLCLDYAGNPDPANPKAWYTFVVRLGRGGVNHYGYYKPSTPLCYQDLPAQGAAVQQLIGTLLASPEMYGTTKVWKLKALENDNYVLGADGKAGSFAADITIAVKE